MRSEDLSRRLVKELMLSEAILEQIIAKVGGTIEDILEVPEPPPSEEEVRSEVAMKTSEEVPKALEIAFPDYLNRTKLKRAVAVKRKWDSATAMAKERAASLAAECATEKATLQEQENRFHAKEMECEVLRSNLVKESDHCAELEQMHADELAKAEEQRAEEAKIAEDLRVQIAAAKKREEELCSKVAELANDRDKEFKRAEELTTSLAKEFWKHEGELTDWAKNLADCESARSSEVECRLKVELERRRLHDRLGKAAMRLEESQRRMEQTETAYR
ncbi:hypothetical protein AXG93_1112s1420 [Marchantia polymorpha subsp. ruderalis]|uniref:Uncharacterized protein n=1 Tax=Marchantia polymorpha subsp. ruderalis TaxID=1480154 RepID=A0A176WB19_MARPO|nr:hypothetical protein AXG93_1112s1420 [Marchantia polymorpha subsp. ruderalis]